MFFSKQKNKKAALQGFYVKGKVFSEMWVIETTTKKMSTTWNSWYKAQKVYVHHKSSYELQKILTAKSVMNQNKFL